MYFQLGTVLFLPLLSAAFIVLFLRQSKWGGAAVSVLSATAALAVALAVMFSESPDAVFKSSYDLFKLGGFTLNFGFLFDGLTRNMMFVVCFVGFLIHVFSVGYMDDDAAKSRFFAGMSFFMFSMSGIVLASNLFMMFIFWELVGFSSYALIAHYADTDAAREASKKAFIVNRVGDLGFLLGIIFCYASLGTTDFAELAKIFQTDPSKASTAMGLLIMCGFLGKSAQFPLQVWLADAMAGPTPVSALIHAATMVAAGVFMMVRLAAIGFLTPEVLDVLTILCALMAFFAGLWALGQNDIKKILAYSTLAHLGLMGTGIGLGYDLAMFHLTTHAFFKATLFLVAGSIIHACHHEQDIFKMGGLFKKMPVTSAVALVATLSIVAIPYFSGYYSKEAILSAAFGRSLGGALFDKAVFWLVMGAAVLTPIYMGRLFFNVFLGKAHSENAQHARESSLWITLPLVVLALYSFAGAWSFAYDLTWLGGKMDFLIPAAATSFISSVWDIHRSALAKIPDVHTLETVALAATAAGIVFAYAVYGRSRGYDIVERKLPRVYSALHSHGWFDDVYNWYVKKVQQRAAIFLATFVDLFLIELLTVRGIGIVCAVIGQGFKRLHDASANSEVKWLVAGFVLLFVLIYA